MPAASTASLESGTAAAAWRYAPSAPFNPMDRKITVNPYLCQGCGACALACPTDAIRLLEPSREELLEAMRQAIQARMGG